MGKTPLSFEKGGFCAGFNKTRKMIEKGCARMVYIASDADDFHRERLVYLCKETDVPYEESLTKKQLAKLCGISVDCAAAAILK